MTQQIPQRLSLVTQAADILRREIQDRVWTGVLPGELHLCERLQVSRMTLRKALSQLEDEGLLITSKGRSRRILSPKQPPFKSLANQTIVFLSPIPTPSIRQLVLFLIDELRDHLGQAGLHLDVQVSPSCYSNRPALALKNLERRLRPAGWVLYQANREMQEWFSQHHLPCVISGTPHESVGLSSVDIDYQAVCRHAVGLFLARGHRRLALVIPHPGLAGDQASEVGFREGVQLAKSGGAEALFLHHDATPNDLVAKLDRLLALPQRPTALLVARPPHFLTVLTYLTHKGIRVPQEIALLSRDDDAYLEHVRPTVARYSVNPKEYARQLYRTVMETVQRQDVHHRNSRLMPRFLDGQTLG